MGLAHSQTQGTNTSIKQHVIEERTAQYKPPQWTLIYYTILVMSLMVGIGSYFNGSTVRVSILRFISFLIGASILSICFLSFVIIPIYVKRYYALARAPRRQNQHREQISHTDDSSEDAAFKNNRMPTDNGAASFAVSHNEPDMDPRDSATVADLDTVLKLRAQAGADNDMTTREKPSFDDQASSLRRMVSTD